MALKFSYSWPTTQDPPPLSPHKHTHTHTPNSYEEQTDVHCRVTMLQSSVAALRWTCCHSDTDTGKWVKFQAFSSLWSRVLSGLHLLQLILHLACVARALCQTHRLWKNNLTGFNLPPSPHHHSPPLLPLAFFFCSFCVPLRGTETILFGSSMPLPAPCKLDRVDLRPPV